MEPAHPGPRVAAASAASANRRSPLARLAVRAEERLGRRVLGQAEGVASVARALRRAAAGISAGRGPLGTLLFVGPTGTGKTELARALAEELGGSARLVRVDCSEYGSRHETSKLLGAPPGYLGHEQGSALARRLQGGAECVVLFDEIEKAHPQLHELLLQVLDEGRLTDGRGQRLDFRRAFVILTSNAGTRELLALRERLGFGPRAARLQEERSTVLHALSTRFAPEFMARIDEVVLFRELAPEALRRVAEQALLDLALRVRAGSKRVCFTAAVARWAARHGQAIAQGARGIQHCIRREIEAPLAEALLAAGSQEWIEVSIRRDRPRFTHAA